VRPHSSPPAKQETTNLTKFRGCNADDNGRFITFFAVSCLFRFQSTVSPLRAPETNPHSESHQIKIRKLHEISHRPQKFHTPIPALMNVKLAWKSDPTVYCVSDVLRIRDLPKERKTHWRWNAGFGKFSAVLAKRLAGKNVSKILCWVGHTRTHQEMR